MGILLLLVIVGVFLLPLAVLLLGTIIMLLRPPTYSIQSSRSPRLPPVQYQPLSSLSAVADPPRALSPPPSA